LAKFNIDTRQTTGFLGIPTPITGLVLGSFAWMSYNLGNPGDVWFIDKPLIDVRPVFNLFWVWLYMPLLAAYMMVSDLPMLAMKFSANDPLRKYKLSLVGLAIPCALFGSAGFIVFYFLYIIVSLLANFANKSN
jgi:CDP-diacylglycerol--serine O-phosphatidyltransferase